MKSHLLLLVLTGLVTASVSPGGNVRINQEEVLSFPSHQNSLHVKSKSVQSSDKSEFSVIQKTARISSTTSTRTIDSLFSRLPSSTELDELIASADSVSILKTVQTLSTNDAIPCSQIVDYLLELLGRIRAAIEKKQFASNQLNVIIDGALAEIARLEKEIKRLEDENRALWEDELKQRLNKLILDLEACYQRFNSVEAQIGPNEAKVVGYRKEIEILERSSDGERNRIGNEKLKLTQIEAEIREFESKLQDAKNRRQLVLLTIQKSEQIISQNDKNIAAARLQITLIEEEIRNLRDEADEIRKRCTNLQVEVERLRTEIAVAEAKEERILAEIQRIVDRINIEKKKLVTEDLDDLNDMIIRLKTLIPGIEREIDRQYYFCYGEGAIEVSQTGSVVVYIVRGESFGNYLLATYGLQVKGLARVNYNFHRIDIFSAIWVNRFGYPFGNSAFSSNDFSFAGDFTCLNPSSVRKGRGIITGISANSITIEDQGQFLSFRLGACTRLQSVTEIPEIGQNFAFRAVPSFAGGYNLYGGTCW